jgi:hypothetical protein
MIANGFFFQAIVGLAVRALDSHVPEIPFRPSRTVSRHLPRTTLARKVAEHPLIKHAANSRTLSGCDLPREASSSNSDDRHEGDDGWGSHPGLFEQSGLWGVVLDSRIQTLTQDITACTVLGDGGRSGTCDCTSTIDFILQTASANTLNFIFPSQGTYRLKIYAAVGSSARILAGSGTAVGTAAFGLGSVTAESVRLVHNFEF